MHQVEPTVPRSLPVLLPVRWFLGLRGLSGLVLAVAAAGGLIHVEQPWVASGLLAMLALSQAFAARTPNELSVDRWTLLLLLDTLMLTGLFAVSGGPGNPFSLLYVLPVLKAALVLPTRRTLALGVASIACFAGLFALAPPHAMHGMGHDSMQSHLWGMLVAYAATVPLVVALAYRVRLVALEAREVAASAADLQSRSERLAALASLAAGAAHELASPLSTIMMVAEELPRAERVADQASDLALIRDEVARCRDVLHGLSHQAGTAHGEPASNFLLADYLTGVATAWSARRGVPVAIDVAEAGQVGWPRQLTEHMVHRLLDNAADATHDRLPIRLIATTEGELSTVRVEDTGEAVPQSVLERAGEPFFSTKPQSQGRGLGVFFVRSTARALGGDFRLERHPTHTAATLELPTFVGARP